VITTRRFADGQGLPEPVPLDQITAERLDADNLVWVDVGSPTSDEIDALVKALTLHPMIADDLEHPHQRTKLERYGDHFHVAVHDCRLDGLRLISREIDVVFGRGWLLTVRGEGPETPDPAVVEEIFQRYDRLRRSTTADDDVGFLLWAILDVIVDRYFVVTDAVDDRLDDIEETVFSDKARDEIPREVFDLRRALVEFRRTASPLREVISELLRRETDYLDEQSLVPMRDVFDHVLRIADLIESQRELLTGLLEAHLAVVSNRMNQVMKLTSSWGAIILGATLIAGIYGMNFRNMPELHWKYGYFIALGMMLVLTLVLVRAFRRRGWL
jgi:magnesium transporter